MAKSQKPRGAALLAAWIGDRPQTAVAAQIGVPAMSLNHWLRGRRVPGLDHAITIEDVTRGAVPARAWVR
jgi:DNA-binding transcriptional regulator YdaS (Cro superfamily)